MSKFILILSLLTNIAIAQGNQSFTDAERIGRDPSLLCHEHCKPRKKMFGIIGDEQSGTERNSCIACIQRNPTVYQMDPSSNIVRIKSAAAGDGVRCILSNDRMYVTCGGDTFKLESANQIENFDPRQPAAE